MKTPITMYDVFPDVLNTGALFTGIDTKTEYQLPWKNDVSTLSLDVAYIMAHSGNKQLAPIWYKVVGNTLPEINEYDLTVICGMLVTLYGDNWRKMWSALTAEYKPLNDYDIEENSTSTTTNTGTTSDSTTNTVQSTDTYNTHNSTQYGGTTTDTAEYNNLTDTHEVAGYNTTDYTPAEHNIKTGGQTNSHTTGGTDVLSKTGDITTDTTASINTTHTNDLTEGATHTTTKAGALYHTKQNLLTAEWEFRKKNFFNEIVFKNIDDVLTLKVY